MYKVTELDSGIKIITKSITRIESASVGVWIAAGSRYEKARLNGVSHFLEHLVFKGTKKRSYRQIKEAIEGSGGILNGFTSEESTCFLAKMMFKDISIAIDVLLDIVFNSQLREADIKKEVKVVFEEIKMYNDLPRHVAHDGLMELLWPKHPLGRNIAGSFKSLKGMNRLDIMGYLDDFYQPDNIVISVCGKIDHDEIVRVVIKILKQRKKRIDKSNASFEPAPIASKQGVIKIVNKKIAQTHLTCGIVTGSRNSPLKYALTLLHVMLGANMSSRLFNELREERGFAYDIGTGIKRFHDTGAFIVHSGMINEKLEQAIQLIFHEIKKISSCKGTADELRRAKQYYMGQLLLGLEDSLDQMAYMGENLLLEGKVKKIANIIKKIESLSWVDVQNAGKLISDARNYNFSIVGPIATVREKNIIKVIKKL